MTDAAPEFWTMGGYGAYVWSAYGLSGLVAGALAVLAVRDLGQARRAAERETARLAAMEAAVAAPGAETDARLPPPADLAA